MLIITVASSNSISSFLLDGTATKLSICSGNVEISFESSANG